MITRIWLINGVLAVLVAFVGIESAALWFDKKGQAPVREERTVEQTRQQTPVVTPQRQRPAAETYTTVVEKNLFSEQRIEGKAATTGGDAETAAVEETDLKIDGKKLLLYGIIIMGNEKIAMIGNPKPAKGEAATKWVKQGERLGDLTITSIDKDRTVLEGQGKRYEILLYDTVKQRQFVAQEDAAAKPQVVTTATKGDGAKIPAVVSTSAKTPSQPPAPGEVGKSNGGGKIEDDEYIYIKTPFGTLKKKKGK